MLSPKYFLFYRVCAIIVAIVAILWWVKVPEEEIDTSYVPKSLENVRNFCYQNCLLQLLASTDTFH